MVLWGSVRNDGGIFTSYVSLGWIWSVQNSKLNVHIDSLVHVIPYDLSCLYESSYLIQTKKFLEVAVTAIFIIQPPVTLF